MAWTLLIAYGSIALVTAVIVLLVSDHLATDPRPFGQQLLLSLAAGVLWPLMLLGVAEISSFAAYAKASRAHDDTELDALS